MNYGAYGTYGTGNGYPRVPNGSYVQLQNTNTPANTQISAAQSNIQMAGAQMAKASTLSDVMAANRAFNIASAQEDAAYAAAQRTAQLMNASALGRGGMTAAATGVGSMFGTNIGYGNSGAYSAAVQNAGSASVFGMGATNNLGGAFDNFQASLNPQNSYNPYQGWNGNTGYTSQSSAPSYDQGGYGYTNNNSYAQPSYSFSSGT